MTGAIPIAISRCHFPLRGLGFGVRTGIWLQGCSIHCGGCIVPETWDARDEHLVSLRALLTALQPWIECSDGVTISGGEPFDQPDALFALLTALRVLSFGDLLIYSGYPWKTLQRHSEILKLCDVVVSEPFQQSHMVTLPLCGSANQRLHTLTDLARERYADWHNFPRQISLGMDTEAIRLAGIMSSDELGHFADSLDLSTAARQGGHGAL